MNGNKDEGNTAMLISREEMDGHVSAGRAERWTQELGPDRLRPNAVLMDGTWYVVLEGVDGYQPANEALAELLSTAMAALSIADTKIADAMIAEASGTRSS